MQASETGAGAEVERAIAQVVQDLQAAGGGNLVGVALYGSLLKGRYTPGLSDINLLVVVADAGYAALVPLAPVLTGAFRQAQIVAFVATPADLRVAARLYPAKILDIQLFHRRLHGELHLAELAVDAGQLSYRTAQELKNMQLRLRRQVIERGAEPAVLWDGVVRSLPKLAVVLGTLLRGRGVQLPLERPALLLQAARELGLAAAAMERFAGLRRRDERPDGATVGETAKEYLELLGSLADLVGEGAGRGDDESDGDGGGDEGAGSAGPGA
jgi:hypothetical protein